MIGLPLRRLLSSSRNCFNFVELNLCYVLKCNITCYQRFSCKSRLAVETNFPRYFCRKSLPFEDFDPDCEYEDVFPVFKKPTKKEAIEMFVNCLECSEAEAATILKDFPKLKTLTAKDVENKIQFFNNIGVEVKEIVQNPWMLWFKLSVIENKLKVTDAMKMKNVKSAIPLLGVPLKRLKELQSWSEIDEKSSGINRIDLISEKLKCDPADLVYIFSMHKFVERIPYDRLLGVIEILLEGGVKPEDILKDIWVVRYSKAQVSSRISRAKEGGIVQFKTWMVRCTEKIFDNTLRRQSEKRTLLGPHKYSAIQYISSRLGVNHEEAQFILTRHPQLRGVGAAKLCNTLDFLLGKEQRSDGPNALEESLNGKQLDNYAKFNQVQVWNSIRALCHSLETMKERLVRLRALGYEPYTPSILYKSRRKFEEFVKKLEEKAAQNQSDSVTSGIGIGNKENEPPKINGPTS